MRSNNTNKFNPQEPLASSIIHSRGSNNTNKFNPQELNICGIFKITVQIIQINSILKNNRMDTFTSLSVQIIQINSILKNNRC